MANHVESRPCGLRARAWWGDQLVAESTATVLVEAPGRPPALYFPCSDIRLDLVGPDMLWRVTHDTPEVGWLSDYAAFDHDRVRVELIDEMDGDDARDVTVKRFPTWGDASHLVDILDVRPDGEGSYVGVARSQERRPVVEGSQMLGQAIVAAGRHAPGRRAVSAHMVFLRAADAREPLQFDLDEETFLELEQRALQSRLNQAFHGPDLAPFLLLATDDLRFRSHQHLFDFRGRIVPPKPERRQQLIKGMCIRRRKQQNDHPD